jgi:hypothetical protein
MVAFLWNLSFAPLGIGIEIFSRWQDQIQKTYSDARPMPSDVLTTEFAVLGGLLAFYVLAFLITGLIFPFAYQLVVDRQMTGWKAVKLSARAARANFGGVLGLVILELTLNALGFLLCCIGLAFVMPWTKSAFTSVPCRFSNQFMMQALRQSDDRPGQYVGHRYSQAELWRRHHHKPSDSACGHHEL